MAKKKLTYKRGKLAEQIQSRYQVSFDSLVEKRALWTEAENIFSNKLADGISSKTKSQVIDPKLSTMILEREARVMNKFATGKFKPISGDDIASSSIMNLIMDKYILKQANAQFSMLTKLRMMLRYSNIYGNMFAMTDWDVSKNGYIGPDLWLLGIRDVFPQVGSVSIEDSDYIIVRTWKTLEYFKNLPKDGNFKNVDKIIERLEDSSGDKMRRDTENKSVREDQFGSNAQNAMQKGYFEVLSQYERDRWVDYVPTASLEFRDTKNPNKDGELPVVCKYSIPLLDDFMGMGDMERGKPMQYTLNSLWNLYLDAVKISIFPPTILNKDNIIASTIKWGAGAKWMVRGSVQNAVQQVAVSPRGTEAFQTTYQTVVASLLNMFGTSDTSTSSQTDPGFGKTPLALKMQSQRESAKDNTDRFYMELTYSQIMKKFANMWSKKQPKQLVLRMFRRELEDLKKLYPEVENMYDEETGKLTLDKSITGSTLFDYEIVAGSTYAIDEEKQLLSLKEMFAILTQNLQFGQDGRVTSPILAKMESEGTTVRIGEMFTRIIAGSGIQDWTKIVVDSKDQQQTREVTPEEQQSMDADQEQFLKVVQGTQPQQEGQMNQSQINQVPAQ